MQNKNRWTDRENKLVVTKGRERRGQIKGMGLRNTNYYA